MFVPQLHLAIWGLCALVIFIIARVLVRRLQVIHFKRKTGAQDAHNLDRPMGLFGLKFAALTIREVKAGRLFELLTENLRVSGPTYQTVVLGRRTLNTVDVDNARSILTNVTDYGVSNRMGPGGWAPFADGGIFVSDGHEWQAGRAMVRPALSRAEISQLDKVETHVAALIRRIPRDGHTVDLQAMFLDMTLDSAMDFLLGVGTTESLTAVEAADKAAFARAVDFCGDQLMIRMRTPPVIRKLFFREEKKFVDAALASRDYITRIVAKQAAKVEQEKDQSGDSKGYILADELLRVTKGDREETRRQVASALIAARDTTALLLSHAFFALARHPDVWAKLQKEVAELGGRKPSYEDLKSMRYLKYVLNETLRYYAIVPSNARWANKDVTMPRGGGPDGSAPCFVPKGAFIIIYLFAMFRDKNVYGPDADEFRPERWGEDLRPGWYFLPFSAGPRVCPGQQFALIEASYTIARLMQEFTRIESRDPRPYQPRIRVSVASANGVLVGLYKDEKP